MFKPCDYVNMSFKSVIHKALYLLIGFELKNSHKSGVCYHIFNQIASLKLLNNQHIEAHTHAHTAMYSKFIFKVYM